MEQLLSAILGPLASQLQGNFLKKSKMDDKWKKRIRFGLSLAVCILGGFLIHIGRFWVDGQIEWNTLLANMGIMFATSQTYYNTYFKLKK